MSSLAQLKAGKVKKTQLSRSDLTFRKIDEILITSREWTRVSLDPVCYVSAPKGVDSLLSVQFSHAVPSDKSHLTGSEMNSRLSLESVKLLDATPHSLICT